MVKATKYDIYIYLSLKVLIIKCPMSLISPVEQTEMEHGRGFDAG